MLAGLAGIICGAVFAAVKLPIPAPPTLAGIAGVVGVFAGYLLVRHLTT